MQEPLPEFEGHDPDRAELHVTGKAGPGRALELGEVIKQALADAEVDLTGQPRLDFDPEG